MKLSAEVPFVMVGDGEVAVTHGAEAMAADHGVAVTYWGRASVGERGVAVAADPSHKGIAGGPGSLLIARYWDGNEYAWAVAIVGQNGIEPGREYRVTEGKWQAVSTSAKTSTSPNSPTRTGT